MAGRLQNIDNSRGQFMGNIAHELGNPMTSIKGFIDGMLDGTIPESEYKHNLGVVSMKPAAWPGWCRTCWISPNLDPGKVQCTP
jgi:Signal transduction histidine kinase